MPNNDAFGFVSAMAAISPEVAGLVAKAQAEQWTPDYFQNMLIGTQWYKTLSPAMREYQTLATTDPAGLAQKVSQTEANLVALQQQYGYNNKFDAHLWATHAVQYGLTDTQVDQMVRSVAWVANPQQLFGQAQEVNSKLKQMAQAYGQSYSEDQYQTWTQKVIQKGDDGFGGIVDINYMNNWYRRVAQTTFPALRDQIDAGMTVQDIAAPYIKSMSQTLEIPETEINVLDPTIRKALTTTKVAGTGNEKTQTQVPMWEFEQSLKSDPRWDRTKNAAQAAYDTLGQLGKDFGFVG